MLQHHKEQFVCELSNKLTNKLFFPEPRVVNSTLKMSVH